MQGRLARRLNTGGCSSTLGGGAVNRQELRQVASKASNRAAVHGSTLPVTEAIDKEEVEKVINDGMEEKEAKKKADDQMEHLENSCSPLK